VKSRAGDNYLPVSQGEVGVEKSGMAAIFHPRKKTGSNARLVRVLTSNF